MARYHESWKTNIKTMYAPMPLEYMAQKIEGKQQEHDYYQSLLDSDYGFRYDPALVDDEQYKKKVEEYRSDMQSLQDELDGTLDFTTTASKIKKMREKYDLWDGLGINYTSSNNTRVGGTGTTSSGKSTGSSKSYTTGSNFRPMSYPWINEYNYNAWQQAHEGYQKLQDPNASMYEWWYVDRPRMLAGQETGGDPTKQRMMQYSVIKPYDEEKLYMDASKMAKGWEEDKQVGMVVRQPYVYIAGKEYVDYNEVYGDERAGVFGWIWQNTDWQNHQNIKYYYGVDKVGNIDYNSYADEYLWRQGYNNLNRNERDPNVLAKQIYGKNYNQLTYEQQQAIQGKISDNIQRKMVDVDNSYKESYAQQIFGKDYNSLSDVEKQQLDQKLRKDVYGLQQFKFIQADAHASTIANREAHERPFMNNLRETPQSKLSRGKALAQYQWTLENGTDFTGVGATSLPLDKDDKKEDVKTDLQGIQSSRYSLIDATTTLKETKTNVLQGLFGDAFDNILEANKAANPLGIANTTENTVNTTINSLEQAGLIEQDSNGSYLFNDNLDLWVSFTGNQNLTVEDLHDMNVELNNAYQKYKAADNEYKTHLYFTQTYNNMFLSSQEGQNYVNDLWDKYIKKQTTTSISEPQVNINEDHTITFAQGETTTNVPNKITVIINGQEKQLTKDEFQNNLSRGIPMEINGHNITENYNDEVADYVANTEIGNTEFVTIYDWNKRTSNGSLKGIFATENALKSNAFASLSMVDYSGSSIYENSSLEGINTDNLDGYKINNVKINPVASGSNDNLVAVTYEVSGKFKVGSKEKQETRTVTTYVPVESFQQAGISNNVSNTMYGAVIQTANNAKNSEDAYYGQNSKIFNTLTPVIASYSPNTKRENIIRNGVDEIAQMKTGDKLLAWETNGVEVYFEKRDNGVYPVVKDTDGTEYYPTNYGYCTDASGALSIIGQIDFESQSNMLSFKNEMGNSIVSIQFNQQNTYENTQLQ